MNIAKNRSSRVLLLLPTASVLLWAGSGCSQETLKSAASDAQKNVVIVNREAQRAERKARPQLNKLAVGARVTAALKANQNLPATIRVDADEDGVKLRGSVRTAAEKSLAERIARDTLKSDKTVQNDLEVKGSHD